MFLYNKNANADIWPCYEFITHERKKCRPDRDHYFINGKVAQLPLKEVLKKTVSRVLLLQRVKDRIHKLKNERVKNKELLLEPMIVKCHSKCGSDG